MKTPTCLSSSRWVLRSLADLTTWFGAGVFWRLAPTVELENFWKCSPSSWLFYMSFLVTSTHLAAMKHRRHWKFCLWLHEELPMLWCYIIDNVQVENRSNWTSRTESRSCVELLSSQMKAVEHALWWLTLARRPPSHSLLPSSTGQEDHLPITITGKTTSDVEEVPGAPPSSLSAVTVVSAGLFLTLFSPHSFLCHMIFCPS